MPDRQNNAIVTATCDGRDLGVFEERTGGDSDSTATSYSLGGLGPRRALGGRPEVSNVVIRRIFDDQARTYVKWLRSRARLGWCVVVEQPIDDEHKPIGEREVFRGILKRVSPPDRNADSDAAGILELEIAVDGEVVS